MQRTFLIGLGSNLPDAYGRAPLDTCRWAAGRVGGIAGLAPDAVSRWYRTAPVPASDQPDYVNGVVRLRGDAAPEEVLAALHAIEAEAGRVRGAANAARVLDLDLLAADGLVRSGPELVLPHPRMAVRGFVLYPLCDVAPEWRHPVLGRTARELRDRLGAPAIEPLLLR